MPPFLIRENSIQTIFKTVYTGVIRLREQIVQNIAFMKDIFLLLHTQFSDWYSLALIGSSRLLSFKAELNSSF